MSTPSGIDWSQIPYSTENQNQQQRRAAAPPPQGGDGDAKPIIIGFKVTPEEKRIIQEYANRMHQQMIFDPTTKQQRRMLENPSIGFMIKIATYAYLAQFNWFIQQLEEQQKQQQQQPQQRPQQQGYVNR